MMEAMKALWNVLQLLLAVVVVLALLGPWGLLALVVVGVVLGLWRAYHLEVLRRRAAAARANADAAQERYRDAEGELRHAQDRARAAGWLVPSEDFSVN